MPIAENAANWVTVTFSSTSPLGKGLCMAATPTPMARKCCAAMDGIGMQLLPKKNQTYSRWWTRKSISSSHRKHVLRMLCYVRKKRGGEIEDKGTKDSRSGPGGYVHTNWHVGCALFDERNLAIRSRRSLFCEKGPTTRPRARNALNY